MVAFDEFADAVVEGELGAPACGEDAGVGDDVIAFVWVFANWGFKEDEIGEVLLDFLAELELGEVGVFEADVVGAATHGGEVGDGKSEDGGGIANVQIVALEMRLEEDDGAIGDSAVNEVVDKEVEAHARGHAEDGSKAEGDGVFAFEDGCFGFDFGAAVEGDGAEGGVLGAGDAGLANTIAAIGNGEEDGLGGGSKPAEHADGIEVSGGSGEGVAVAEGSADEGS